MKAGLRVPEDLSLVGCDNLVFTAYTNPPLTSIDTKQQELGARAVRMLLEGTQGREDAEWVLVERESCGKAVDRT